MAPLSQVQALTFDLFGTILDLGGSLTPHIRTFLQAKSASVSAEQFWADWRARQRIEQYQDTLLMLGHSGYLTTARRGFVYTLKRHNVAASDDEVTEFMRAWQQLSPFGDVVPALEQLSARYRLVILSNGEPDFLQHLAQNRVKFAFDDIFSVETVGAFKPHPSVYRRAAQSQELEVGECLMVSANSFDVMGARACGFRSAFVNRYKLPYEDSVYQPDLTVPTFTELAEALLTT